MLFERDGERAGLHGIRDLVREHARNAGSRDRRIDGGLGRVYDESRMDRDRRIGFAKVFEATRG